MEKNATNSPENTVVSSQPAADFLSIMIITENVMDSLPLLTFLFWLFFHYHVAGVERVISLKMEIPGSMPPLIQEMLENLEGQENQSNGSLSSIDHPDEVDTSLKSPDSSETEGRASSPLNDEQ